MKTYEVTITETLRRVVKIEAESNLEALDTVSAAYKNGDHVLDYTDYVGAELKSRLFAGDKKGACKT